jgi:hypothetical protein
VLNRGFNKRVGMNGNGNFVPMTGGGVAPALGKAPTSGTAADSPNEWLILITDLASKEIGVRRCVL